MYHVFVRVYKADVQLGRTDIHFARSNISGSNCSTTECTAVTYRSRETNLPIRAILICRPERVIFWSKRNKEVIRRGTREVEIFSLYITVICNKNHNCTTDCCWALLEISTVTANHLKKAKDLSNITKIGLWSETEYSK